MIKSLLTAAALLATLAPAATAETRENFSVEIFYNAKMLATDAVEVERSIETQARRVCAVSYTRVKRIDEACVAAVVASAMQKIEQQRAANEGRTLARLVVENETSFQ